MKKIAAFVVLFLMFFVQVFAEPVTFIGRAEDVKYEEVSIGGVPQIKQAVRVKVLGGKEKGKIYQIDNILGGNPYYDINISPKDKVILQADEDSGVGNYYISDVYRVGTLIFLGVIFCALVVFVGKRKGGHSLISILLTLLLILYVLCPLILAGISPLFATLVVCFVSTILTMYLVGGVNRKSLAATLGTLSALVVSGVAALLTIKFAKLTGFSDETTLYLYSSHPELSYTSLCASVIILAALGAVMDVAMSIASTINEIHINNKNLSKKELFNAGMNVGRDIIGTMANTLILVYMGAALPLLLLSTNIDHYKFFNLNTVVTEISSAIIGSIALVICVPLTAIIAANLVKLSEDENLEKRDTIELETN